MNAHIAALEAKVHYMAAPTIPSTSSDNSPSVPKPSGDAAGDIFVVLNYDESNTTPTNQPQDGAGHNLSLIGRLRPGGRRRVVGR